ncbi:cytochrome P450 6B5-like [Belonocnema kinseyi]|uniref:cytochrome P450 6B5-like n=1 Tax=Belonocnema kinseyi TaxID=2817044 RepID=UPI00143CC3CD|nr:cytochrome P450 6B5-like [Belonocnema kinseyi]
MELQYILTSVILVLLFVYYYLSSQYNYWRKRGIPSADGVILGLGNMWPVLSGRVSLSTFCENLYKKASDQSMIGFYRLSTPMLLVRDPDLVKSILQTNFSSFSENQIKINSSKYDELLRFNPFFVSGEKWKKARAPLTNSFSSMKLKTMFPLFQSAACKMSKYLRDKCSDGNGKVELNLKKFCNKYTGEISSTGMGIEAYNFDDVQCQKNEWKYNEILSKIFENSSLATGIRQMILFFMPSLAKLLNISLTPKEVDQFFRQSAKSILANRKKENRTYNDFMQIVLDYQKTHESEIDEETLVASHMLSFAVDVYETTAATLSFLGFELAHRPEIQENVRKEIETLLVKYNGELNYEALQEMTYLEKVLNESMRINHVVGTTFKLCTKETKLVGADGLTCTVKPGTAIVICALGIQMDAKYWPEPEKFDPERFSEEQKNNRQKFTFLPFGEGPRTCVGMRMAILLIKAAIATILKDFSIQLSPKMSLPWKRDETSFLNTPQGGFLVHVKPLVQSF